MDRLQKINTLSCYPTYSDIFTNNTENLQLTRVFQIQINEKLQILNDSQNQMIYLKIPSKYRIKKRSKFYNLYIPDFFESTIS